ncbi:tannase/feruloyl esterase family alpha/beta hydrolase [Novosphingobium malaysiense]|uniref:tannase/feruloyl esterase family alpha/beta hydrolase n=1 Tax=Novosphingobium malaysiense TaxID=1348853 RepID=UPI000691C0D2|nr:tannase/feruloyl esterase family alpha/beta hydrolase [Novosphingobium malaysiense]
MQVEHTGWAKWVSVDDVAASRLAEQRCTVEAIADATREFDGYEIVSARVNRTGEFLPPAPFGPAGPPAQLMTDLPDFCEVLARKTTPGGHVAEIFVWAPLQWNERFLCTVGAGSRTMQMHDLKYIRNLTLPNAVRNGFATAATDGGNRDPRPFDWAMRPEDGTLDEELIENWVVRSTHDMTVIAKAIITFLYGEAPKYSYLMGCSGGGRQTLAIAQQHPELYDGYWSSDPAINWPQVMGAALWPAIVMHLANNAIPKVKFEAFRQAAISACDGSDGVMDGFLGAFDPCDFDPASIVGQQTEAGAITATDAEVMRRIWEGPRRADGSFLWFGLRPGIDAWSDVGICMTVEVDGILEPMPFWIAPAHFRWVLEDPAFDWKTMDFAMFEKLFDLGVEKLASTATNDPDLSALRDSGAKLIISQAADDEVLPYESAVDYYQRVVEAMGGLDAVTDYARFFVTDGDKHSFNFGYGPGLTLAGGISALMNWVEHGVAPDEIVAERYDPQTDTLLASRPAYPYPYVTRYKGEGDPAIASSYKAVRIEPRRVRDTSALPADA